MRAHYLLVPIFLFGCTDGRIGYKCFRDDECALNGQHAKCIYPQQSCALPSPNCPSGFVFHSSAGANAGKCVPEDFSVDMGDAGGGDQDMNTEPGDIATTPPPDMAMPIDMSVTPKTLTWTAQSSGVSSEFYGVFATGNTAWAVGGSTIRYTNNGGATWTPQTTGAVTGTTSELYYDAWGASATELWLVGIQSSIMNSMAVNKAIIYHTSNGGGIWTAQNPGQFTVSGALRGVGGSAAADVFAVGDSGKTFHNNATDTWDATATLSPANYAESVFAAGSNTVYVAARGGYVFKSLNGGGSWAGKQIDTTPHNLYAIWGASATDVWVIGAGGVAYHTIDGGGTWSGVQTGVMNDLTGVSGTGVDDVVIVGAGGVVLHFYDGTLHREDSTITTSLAAVAAGGPKNYFAVGAQGVILHGQ